MTDWDNLSGDELNRRIAELRGWKHRVVTLDNSPFRNEVWFDEHEVAYDLPDVAGDNCTALEAAERMKGQEWFYETGYWEDGGYSAIFWKEGQYIVTDARCDEQPKLSLAVARAMGKALEAGK